LCHRSLPHASQTHNYRNQQNRDSEISNFHARDYSAKLVNVWYRASGEWKQASTRRNIAISDSLGWKLWGQVRYSLVEVLLNP
jgi:hypothetical protein